MNVPAELRKYGLVEPAIPDEYRLVLTLEGDGATGKSHLVLETAPRPLLVLNLDKNLEGIEGRYVGQDILIKHVKMPVMLNQEVDKKQFIEARDLVLAAIEKHHFRTVFIDTGDALYELCRRGFLGALGFGEAKQSDFDVVNANMRRFYRAAKEVQGVNLIVSHRVDDEYIDKVNSNTGKKMGTKTGRRVLRGWKDTMFESQCHVRLTKDPKVVGIRKFKAEIVKCTARTEAEGEELIGEDITFSNIGMLVYPETVENPEVWESRSGR